MASTSPAGLPWTVRIGVLLLSIVSIGLVALMVLVAIFAVASIGLPGAQPTVVQVIIGVFGLTVPALLLLIAVIFTMRRHAWARWLAVVVGIVGGTVALLAQLSQPSPAAPFIWAAAASILGGALLALPPSGAWIASRTPRQQPPLAPWTT